jgi:hypothetical protein
LKLLNLIVFYFLFSNLIVVKVLEHRIRFLATPTDVTKTLIWLQSEAIFLPQRNSRTKKSVAFMSATKASENEDFSVGPLHKNFAKKI